ncbi:hypothetical protein LPTSP3_g22340 [Leptospira kobayashii]|uniref:Uncharacterized protein n=1 Tax=Leptospira kobayashii TaxID=1917830 RepID=A0ABM7URY3_9LEPT|nr:hypothetical protein [Leptospira kobayashii]BDA79304.1 hypothetical protein LPTSP3_g22340 [Leptospira kobayashii]
MSQFPKTILFIMVFTLFTALFQLLLKAETKATNRVNPKKTENYKPTLRSDGEPIHEFVKRYQKQAFETWGKGYPNY